MIRDDVLDDSAKQVDFGDFIKKKLDDMKVPAKTTWWLISISFVLF